LEPHKYYVSPERPALQFIAVLDCFRPRATHIEGPAPTLACADAEAHPVLGEEARRELAFGSGGNERSIREADLPPTILASSLCCLRSFL
jgi:hypothetical protein